MSSTTPEQEREEARLAIDLKHTLKLVPLSQRGLFISELAKYTLARDAQREAEIRKNCIPKESAEYHRQEMMKYKASLSHMTEIQIMQIRSVPGNIADMYDYHKSMYEQLASLPSPKPGKTIPCPCGICSGYCACGIEGHHPKPYFVDGETAKLVSDNIDGLFDTTPNPGESK